ncbi:MAG: helix-turn-helix domain-containing protein, partial [Myxococcota bacterium]
EAVRALRGALGWSQAELAKRVGVSQPLVSSWESGRRAPRGAALRALSALAASVDSPTEASAKRPREALLEAALRLLAADGGLMVTHLSLARELGLDVRRETADLNPSGAAFLEEYRRRMEAETDRLREEAERRREPRPRLWAYLEQARHAVGSDQTDRLHRQALLGFMVGDGPVAQDMHRWYRRQVEEVLAEATSQQEQARMRLAILAVDAVWFFELIGLWKLDDHHRRELVDAAWSASWRPA